MACPVGFYKSNDPKQRRCQGCSAGRYGEAAGLSACVACEPGKTSAEGSVFCENCAVGKSTESRAGEAKCSDCSRGTFAEHTEQSACARCPIGTFQPLSGETTCTSCGAEVAQGSSTLFFGARKGGWISLNIPNIKSWLVLNMNGEPKL